jgi:hypothetical protein
MGNEKKKARKRARKAGEDDSPTAEGLTNEELDQVSGGTTPRAVVDSAESSGWTKEHSRKNGAIVAADFNYKPN